MEWGSAGAGVGDKVGDMTPTGAPSYEALRATPSPGAVPVAGEAASMMGVAAGYQGEVVYMYAFDVAYEMTRKPVTHLLGHPLAEFVVGASKRSPRQFLFYRPLT